MGKAERDKGRKGEREVATLFETAGLTVRGLEAAGDHLMVCDPSGRLVVHSEVKRHETARVWQWWEQATAEAPAGSFVAVTFRRSRSPWLSLVSTVRLAEVLATAGGLRYAELVEAGNELADLLDPLAVTDLAEHAQETLGAITRWDAIAGGRS